jgi:hypothetical protein
MTDAAQPEGDRRVFMPCLGRSWRHTAHVPLAAAPRRPPLSGALPGRPGRVALREILVDLEQRPQEQTVLAARGARMMLETCVFLETAPASC